jgi:hypothetical protein
MKKTYFAPSVESILIESQSMLAASVGEVPIDPDNPATPAVQKKDEDFWNYEWK